ncbi:GNAT family N-acetyltransferase [Amnibacterium sp.]|uniref:GNAT family N-acetyltransferase n=1 Tax=Amnibacterium sp. TaxID=1872496 RepID=UPI002632C839|nr:GNAT family N-acetyltransferase [Amnibacterium sp.]MCU1474982.1 family N-acetyltransferase [Amnibacterium sp.]
MTVIRPLTLDDAPATGRMHLAAWHEAYDAFLPQRFWDRFTEEARIAAFARMATDPWPGQVIVVAERDGRIVGVATSGPTRTDLPHGRPPATPLELYSLYVLEAEYGSGTAARLLAAVLPDGAAAELWVFEPNARALAFYAKHGFVPDGARFSFGPEIGEQAEIRLVRGA